MFLCTKDSYEGKLQFLINKQKNNFKAFTLLFESFEWFIWMTFKSFIEYLNNIDDIHNNIEEYNPNKKNKILITFYDDISAYVRNNSKN